MALTWINHRHSAAAAGWFSGRSNNDAFLFCRISQLGFMQLLATTAIMGKEVLTIGEAWKAYDRWLEDSRVSLRQEPPGLDATLRVTARSVAKLPSPKALSDCYLLAVSGSLDATLVTFDLALASACQKARQPVTLLD